jgi:hypothetical protein
MISYRMRDKRQTRCLHESGVFLALDRETHTSVKDPRDNVSATKRIFSKLYAIEML